MTETASPTWNRQRPSGMAWGRYRPVEDRVAIPLENRTWPSAHTRSAPLWVPVDLRDGNQALAEPMDPSRKRRMFDLMVRLGYKEIEVGYPSASQTDFDFVRSLVGTVPNDVTIVVFTAARDDLIARTFLSIEGLSDVVVHMYTATAPTWRQVVLAKERDELRELIFAAGETIARSAGTREGIRFEFSPEVFNLTEPDYVLEICNGMSSLWDASPDRPVIHNLPATVEVATPNIYADQIEYMHRHLDRRGSVILSVHPHNDRGTGVACAELAVMAGAQRVEGCLFGNGERTGNVDLVTLALNLYAQGVDPMIDFSDIDEVRRTVEYCNRIAVHERHPYAGDLVYTAFSGTHQDAIKKGLTHHRAEADRTGVAASRSPWAVPYLPIDPADVGRDYDAVIRVNSQSGKGGSAYLLEADHGLVLPRRLQIDFARTVQRAAENDGVEVTSEQLWDLFCTAYTTQADLRLVSWDISTEEHGKTLLRAIIREGGADRSHTGIGSGPVDALANLLGDSGREITVLGLTQHSIASGNSATAVTYVEASVSGATVWGVALSESVVESSLHAVMAAVHRAGVHLDAE
ncbi:2-isopropylmalate synthase [Rhodococcoides yunnanense]|uniref:2-isopropylmalate synthase n=1 Tax=Rhodococcoides yunnanense TaxID=278209 RepID=UPI0009333A7B|nr:2-isopropylmalate synthase [Rhodococcus yunnanensis]